MAAMVGFEFDLDMVSWSDIEFAMRQGPIARSAVEFQGFLQGFPQDKRRNDKLAVRSLSLHANHLADHFISRNVKVGPDAPRLLMLIAPSLGILIGQGAKLVAESYVPPVVSDVVSGVVSAGLATAIPLLHHKIKSYVVADTLRAEGEKEFGLIR